MIRSWVVYRNTGSWKHRCKDYASKIFISSSVLRNDHTHIHTSFLPIIRLFPISLSLHSLSTIKERECEIIHT